MDQPVLTRVPCPNCGHQQTRFDRRVNGFTLERCRRCQMVFVNPQYTPEDLGKLYTERDAAFLIDLYARLQTPSQVADDERILDDLEKVLPGRGRLIDFGCGAGYFFERALKRGWDAHGVELGPWARQAAELRGLKNLHVGDVADQPFPDGWADVVCAHQVLEHLPRPKEELTAIGRLLRPGGLFYANVPNYRCLSILLGRDDFEYNMPPQHVNYFTSRTLCALLERCGFRIIYTSSFGGVKWENLLGRPIRSEMAQICRQAEQGNAARPGAEAGNPAPANAKPSFLKKMLSPLVNTLLYRKAQVGINLEVFARKPEQSRPARARHTRTPVATSHG